MSLSEKVKLFFETDLEELASPQKNLTRIKTFAIFCVQTTRSVIRHQTMTMSSALAFKTLMAVVPLILIGIAVASALGNENGHSYSESFFQAIEEKIPSTPFLKPLLDLLKEISTRAREIAGIGLILLFITAYSLLSSVEWAFNRIWQVTGKRKIINRVISYLATIIIVPVLMSFSVYLNAKIETVTQQVASSIESTQKEALGLFSRLEEKVKTPEEPQKTEPTINKNEQSTVTAEERSEPSQNSDINTNQQETTTQAATEKVTSSSGSADRKSQPLIVKIVLGVISIIISCIALTALFYFMPYTPVKLKPALYGGALCGVMIELLKYFYSYYAMHASTNLTRLYGSTLLALPLTLLWLWLVWTFILMGVEISFNLQNYRDLAISDNIEKQGLDNRLYLAVRIVLLASEYFNLGRKPLMFIDAAAEKLRVPPFIIRTLVEELTEKEVLREVTGVRDGYLPARDITELTVYDVIDAITADKFTCAETSKDAAHDIIARMFNNTSEKMEDILRCESIHQLLEDEGFLQTPSHYEENGTCC